MNTSEIKRNAAQYGEYIAQEAAYTAENMSARTAGSVAEADASEYIAGKLTAAGAEVRTEEFKVAPAAAFGWIGVTAVCMMLAYVAYFFVSMVSVALIIVALVPFVVQGVFLSRAFDGAYIQKTSRNVTAVLPCSGEVRRRVFFTAHADSARNFRPYVKGRHALVAAVAAISLVGAAYLLGADIARWAYLGSVGTGLVRGDWLTIGLVGIVFVPFWGAALFVIDGKRASAGAGDNLTGCFAAAAVVKALAETGVPEHTEVGVIVTGAEECGLRGAKAWCDAHAAEYRDGKTYFVTLDTLRDAGRLKAQKRDLNGLQTLDKELVARFSESAGKAGLECGKGGFAFGATDAAAFAAAGLKAVAVTAFDPMSDTYHTENDVADSLDSGFLGKCVIAAVQFVEDLENGD